MNDEEKEELLKTIFINTDSEYCSKARCEYYATKLKHMGKNVKIGTGVKFVNPEYISIGDNVEIMDNVTIIARGEGGNSKKVSIGKDCYIGMGVCIMYSGDIGDGSVIGSGSTVVKPIPSYSVAVGTPAKTIKNRG